MSTRNAINNIVKEFYNELSGDITDEVSDKVVGYIFHTYGEGCVTDIVDTSKTLLGYVNMITRRQFANLIRILTDK